VLCDRIEASAGEGRSGKIMRKQNIRMIPKSGNRFSGKIMRKQNGNRSGFRFDPIQALEK
jgi:hypothetical protein